MNTIKHVAFLASHSTVTDYVVSERSDGTLATVTVQRTSPTHKAADALLARIEAMFGKETV